MNLNKKTKIILYIVALLIILALAGIYVYNKHQETKEIQEMNKQEFSFLKCISTCPVTYSLSTNKSSIKPACISNCTDENNVSKELQNKYPQKQIIKDWNYISCINKIDVRDSMTYEKYQTCLTNLFPKLQEKYPYLK